MANLEYGTTYYQVTYADPKSTMPGLKPMVYIGKNLFGTENGETHYFQDTVSVLVFGLFNDAKDTSDCKISSCSKEDLASTFVSIDEATKIISEAAKKAKELGFPKLQKASGKWQKI